MPFDHTCFVHLCRNPMCSAVPRCPGAHAWFYAGPSANVLLTRDWDAKVGDFGLCKALPAAVATASKTGWGRGQQAPGARRVRGRRRGTLCLAGAGRVAPFARVPSVLCMLCYVWAEPLLLHT